MSKVRKLFRNTIINYSSAMIASVFTFLFTIIVARYLGSENYGFLTYALSIIVLMSAFNDLGLGIIAVRDVAKNGNEANNYFSNVFASKVILSLIVSIVALLSVPFLIKDPIRARSLSIFILAGFFYLLHVSYRWIYTAFQAFEYEGAINIIQSILTLIAAITVITLHKGIIMFASLWIVVNLLQFVIGLYFASRLVPIRLTLDPTFVKKLLLISLPVGLTTIFSMVYLNLDKILLFQLKNGFEVGLYGAASKIMVFIKGLVFMFMPVALPAFSDFSVNMGSGHFIKLLNRSFHYIMAGTLAASLGVMILARQIVLIIFGAQFLASVPVLQLVIWALPFTCLSGIIGCCLISIGRQKEFMLTFLTGLLINVAMNLIFIPAHGYMSTSVAVVVSEAVMFIIMYLLAMKYIGFSQPALKTTGIFLSLATMGAFTYYFQSLSIVINIPLSALIYFIALFLTRAIGWEDVALFKKMLIKEA